MSWRVLRVEGDDFMSYEHLDLDLTTLPHLTLILGNRGPGRSNGAGKSTVFELIAWTLYGETCRKLAAVEKVIRRGCTKCVGRVTVGLSDGTRFVVERARGPSGPSLRVTGQAGASTTAGAQAVINATLGDRQSFTTTAMFSGAMSSFCRLPDSTRKELLERMAGCDGYEGALELAKTRAEAARSQLQGLELEAVRTKSRFDHAVQRRSEVVNDCLTRRSRLIDAHIDAMERAVDVHDRTLVANRALRAWLDIAAAERSKADDVKAAAEREVDRLDAKIATIDAELGKIALAAQGFRSRIKTERDDIENMKAGRHADLCPKCGQRWPQDGDPVEIAKQVKVHEAVILENRTKLAPLEERVPELTSMKEELRLARQEAQRVARTANAAFDEREYRRLLQVAIQAETDLAAAHEAAHAAAEAVPEEPSTPEELEPLDRAVEDAQEEMTRLTELRVQLVEQVRRLQFWGKGFGRAGLPSFLVDGAVPDMNDVVLEVAQTLTNGELTVRFNPSAAKGTQSILAVEVDYAEGGQGFDSSSRGEQTRVDVAVLFALRDLATRRIANPCTQLFLDEVMDGTDDHFSQSFMDLLRSRYKDLQVLLVSHDPAVSSLCDTTLVASKRGPTSSLSKR